MHTHLEVRLTCLSGMPISPYDNGNSCSVNIPSNCSLTGQSTLLTVLRLSLLKTHSS